MNGFPSSNVSIEARSPVVPLVMLSVSRYTRAKAMLAHVRGEAPDPMLTRKAMNAKLAQPEHGDRYRKRQQTVEPVFGNIKANLGYRRFTLRGLPAVNSEWRLICASHNLLKLWRKAPA